MRVNSFVPNKEIFDFGNVSSKNNIKNDGEISFVDTLKKKLDEVNEKQIDSDIMTNKMIKGDDVNIHEVMLCTEEAKMSLQLAVQVRNKLLDAYQEINRMQL